MANNYQANASTINNGPTLSMTDVSGSSFPTTGLASNVVVYAAVDSSTQPAVAALANPLYCGLSDGTTGATVNSSDHGLNVHIAGGAIPSGTNVIGHVIVDAGTAVIGHVINDAGTALMGYVKVTSDGTHFQPSGDDVARPIIVELTDGTGTLGFDNSNTTAKVSAYGKGSAAGDTAIPAGDNAAHSVFVSPNDGTNKFLSGTATNVAAGVGTNAMLVTKPGAWTANNTSSAAAQATVTKTAGAAGVKYVIDSITVSLAAGAAAQTPLTASLIQDAGGTPVTLWAGSLSAPANSGASIAVSGLSIIQTVAAKDLTLQWSAAGTTNTIQSVAMTGTSVA